MGGWSAAELKAHVRAGRVTRYGRDGQPRFRSSEVVSAMAKMALAVEQSASGVLERDTQRPLRYDVPCTPLPELGTGFLYLLEIYDLGTKVGVSVAPEMRVIDHARAAWQWARRLGRFWVSEPHAAWRANENLVKRALLPPGHRTEYLPVSFDDALAVASSLSTGGRS